MRVHSSKDCGNSPKNMFVQDMAVAFETGNVSPGSVTEDLSLLDPSNTSSVALQRPFAWLIDQAAPVEIHVVHAIAHGRTGASNGFSKLEDGSTRHFSYIFEFKNTTAKCISVVYRYS